MSDWKDNEVVISCFGGFQNKWVVHCPAKDDKTLASFQTEDEVREYCNKNGLEIVYWAMDNS